MESAFGRKYNNWPGYLLLSVAITAMGTVILCFLLVNYNLFMDNQLSVIDKIILVLAGTWTSVLAGTLNIKAIAFLLKSATIKKKYGKLLLLNLPLFIFQLFVFFAALLILLYD